MNLDVLCERARLVNEGVLRLQGMHEQLETQQEEYTAELNESRHRQIIIHKVAEVLKKLLDDLLDQNLRSLESLVSSGLKAVFQDQKVRFKTQVKEHGGKLSIDLVTEENGVEGGVDSFGASVAAVESFLLRLYVMRKVGLAPYLFLDESFASVENSNIDNIAQLCKILAGKLGISIFLITHQERFLEHADIAYRGSSIKVDGKKVMSLKRVR